ncbi:zincin [Auriculariales sp. MPI-PUGE-AT-0066]|nr:zincin [Auriculariales sp. MPI-PUGE-AT-0066]
MARLSLALLALASTALAAVGRTRHCGSTPSADKIAVKEAHFKSLLSDDGARTAFANKVPSTNSSVIQTHVHVIRAGDSLSNGNVPDMQVEAQIDVLNKDYARTGYSFKLANINYVTNAKWWNMVAPESDIQAAMKKKLRVGDASVLNVYLVSFGNPDAFGLLGYATFPSDAASALSDDGVVILYSSLPGGTSVPYDEGRTLTHEVGHWVGLYHTFQGGCSDGDMVKDTPAQDTPTSGCKKADTCPKKAGVDAIHNYMDYSDDSCMTEFSKGQITRMQQQLKTYRGISPKKTTKSKQL